MPRSATWLQVIASGSRWRSRIPFEDASGARLSQVSAMLSDDGSDPIGVSPVREEAKRGARLAR